MARIWFPTQEEYTRWEYCEMHGCYAIVRTGSPYRLHVGWGPLSRLTVVRAPYPDGRLNPVPYTNPRSVDLHRDDNLEDAALNRRIRYWMYVYGSDPLV